MLRLQSKKVVRQIEVAALLVGVILWFVLRGYGDVHLDAGDKGREIGVLKGKIVEVALESDPASGYAWEITNLPDQVLEQVGQVQFKPHSGRFGGPPVQVFRFEAIRRSQRQREGTLNLAYRPTGEENVPIADTFWVDVMVSK